MLPGLNDVIGCQLDRKAGTVSFSKNGEELGEAKKIPQALKVRGHRSPPITNLFRILPFVCANTKACLWLIIGAGRKCKVPQSSQGIGPPITSHHQSLSFLALGPCFHESLPLTFERSWLSNRLQRSPRLTGCGATDHHC